MDHPESIASEAASEMEALIQEILGCNLDTGWLLGWLLGWNLIESFLVVIDEWIQSNSSLGMS